MANFSQEWHSSVPDGTVAIFCALSDLTSLLHKVLTFVYDVHRERVSSDLDTEETLSEWIHSLDENLREIVLHGLSLHVPGAGNLRLSYLFIQLVLRRIALEAERHTPEPRDALLRSLQSQCHSTSENILQFTRLLQHQQLTGFWLSASTFIYPTAMSFLLRCALDTNGVASQAMRERSRVNAKDLLDVLECHKNTSSWDVGDLCLVQYKEIVESISSSGVPSEQQSNDVIDSDMLMMDFLTVDTAYLDQFFPGLWDVASPVA